MTSIGKPADEVLRDAIVGITKMNHGGSVDRLVNHYSALSIVSSSKSSQPSKPKDGEANWVHNQISKIISGASKETNMRFFLGQLLVRLRDIEKKGALMFSSTAPEGSAFSARLKDVLFNKRDEGYFFRKFQKEKHTEQRKKSPSPDEGL